MLLDSNDFEDCGSSSIPTQHNLLTHNMPPRVPLLVHKRLAYRTTPTVPQKRLAVPLSRLASNDASTGSVQSNSGQPQTGASESRLPHVTEEQAELDKVMGQEPPEIEERGTPVSEVCPLSTPARPVLTCPDPTTRQRCPEERPKCTQIRDKEGVPRLRPNTLLLNLRASTRPHSPRAGSADRPGTRRLPGQ
jgi:hypothetical protein